MKSKRSRGLTLVEVLIASTILFAALTVAAETYRTVLSSSQKAAVRVELLTPIPTIVLAIRQELRDNPRDRVEGAGEMLGVSFSFEAVTTRFAPPAAQFDVDLGEFADYAPRFRVYDVRLEVRANSLSRSFVYQELAWTELERR